MLLRNGVQIARIQHWLGKHSIALSLLENIIEEARQLLGESSAELTTWQTIRCRMLSDLGNADAAVEAMTGVVRGCREHHGEDHPAYAKALVWLAHVQARAGRIERARTTLTKVDEYLVQKPLDTWILDQKTQVESRLHDANAR